jgi:hypothetical protein
MSKKEGIMRFKTSIILFAFLCGTIFFMDFGCQAEEPVLRAEEWNQPVETIMELVDITQLSAAQQAEFKKLNKIQELSDKIIGTRDLLTEFFRDDLFIAIGEHMQRRGTRILFVNDVYKNITGAKAIELYFECAKEKKQAQLGPEKGLKLEFSIQSISVTPFGSLRTVWDGKKYVDDVDMRIHITFKFHIIEDNKSSTFKNDRGEGEWDCFHRQGCPLICGPPR